MSSTKPFSFDTIENFDEHIAQSIPNYHKLEEAISDVSRYFLREDTAVIDLGCSTGKLLESIPFDGDKYGIDMSSHLLPASHDRTVFVKKDIRAFKEFPPACLVMSIFTLQFIPLEDRKPVIDAIYGSLIEGGAFIWAEKVHEEDGLLEQIQTGAYYDYKRKSFTAEEILNKERDIRGMMRTQTTDWNVNKILEAGFSTSTLIWKFFNFECHLAIK